MSRKTTTNDKALGAFVTRKAEIDAMLARLQQMSAGHFEVGPNEVDWGHVGNLDHVIERLTQVSDFLFKEGDHAA